MNRLLKYEGYNYFRQRLILATLSGKPVRIEKIRSDDENPGLRGKISDVFRYLLLQRLMYKP